MTCLHFRVTPKGWLNMPITRQSLTPKRMCPFVLIVEMLMVFYSERWALCRQILFGALVRPRMDIAQIADENLAMLKMERPGVTGVIVLPILLHVGGARRKCQFMTRFVRLVMTTDEPGSGMNVGAYHRRGQCVAQGICRTFPGISGPGHTPPLYVDGWPANLN